MREDISAAALTDAYTRGLDEHASLFGGGYANYGFWKAIPLTKPITPADRIASQQALYRLALDRLDLSSTDTLLEVGCGRGAGAALALKEYGPAAVHGVDLLPSQIHRSTDPDPAAQDHRLVLRTGSAVDLPYPARHFDKIVSIEAAQHFPNMAGFAGEVARVARRPARLALATVLTPAPGIGLDDWLDLLGFMEGLTHAHAVSEVTGSLVTAGFSNVDAISIGEHVWRGFDAWVAQTRFEDSDQRNWLTAYDRHLLDYFLITAELDDDAPEANS